MNLLSSCEIYYGDRPVKQIWYNNNLVWTPCVYTFNITILSIPTVEGFNPDPPCPRVNSFAEGSTSYNFVTSVTSYTDVYDLNSRGEAGVDVFYWTQFQDAYVTYSGNPFLTSVPAGEGDQTKLQIRYNTPNTYNITVELLPKATPCNQEANLSSSGQAYPVPYITAFNIGPELGTVRIVGSANSSPDRFVFELNNTIVLDTLYRGSSSYQSAVNAVHDLYGNPYIDIIQCNDCGAGDNDSHGEFDLSFEKTTTDSLLKVSAFMPIDESFNSWNLTVFCPEVIEPSIFGFEIEDTIGDK
jgi:hypothetical protein